MTPLENLNWTRGFQYVGWLLLIISIYVGVVFGARKFPRAVIGVVILLILGTFFWLGARP